MKLEKDIEEYTDEEIEQLLGNKLDEFFIKLFLEIRKIPNWKEEYNKFIQQLVNAFRKSEYKCQLCKKKYTNWSIPSEWWNKLPEELRGKYLCFDCYMKEYLKPIEIIIPKGRCGLLGGCLGTMDIDNQDNEICKNCEFNPFNLKKAKYGD